MCRQRNLVKDITILQEWTITVKHLSCSLMKWKKLECQNIFNKNSFDLHNLIGIFSFAYSLKVKI